MKKRLLSQKRLSQLVFSIGMILLYINVSWGQQTIGSFPYMDGGFEGQTTGNLTQANTGSANVWTKNLSTSTSSIVANASLARTGSKYAIGNIAGPTGGVSAGSNRGLQTPLGASVAGSHVIQFYYRNYPVSTNIQAGIAAVNGAIQVTSATPSTEWVRASFVVTSAVLSSTYSYVGRLNLGTTGSSFSYDVDDVVVYAGTAVDETAPTVLASNPIVSTITSSQQTISWDASTDADFSGYMVVRGIADPATTPKVNGIYAVGNTVATGEQVIYMGNGTSFTDLGLAQNTTYYYRIYTVDKAFNYSATALSFNSTTTAPVVIATEPTVQVSGLTLGNVTGSTLDINWTEGDGTNSLVLVKAASAVDTDPTDGGIYTANLAFGSGTQIGTGNYAVYTGTGNSATITGLTRGTTYFVKVYTFNVNAQGSENYLTTSPASGSILNLPYQNTFTFNSTAEGFTTLTRAVAVQATESLRGTLKINSPAANRLTTIVGLNTSYARVDVTTNKYAHITLKNMTTNNNIQLVCGSTNFNPRQIITTSDGDYKTYDFDLSTLTGDQYPTINISVKDTWSGTATYAVDDTAIQSNGTYKNLTGVNTATVPRSDTTNWVLVGTEGGLLDFTNFIYIDSIVFDNVPPTIVSNGTGGGAWSTETTWAGGIAPETNDNVTILGSDTVNSTGATPICNNLTLAGTLNITGGKLTVKNTLVNNGTITIDNNANLVQTAVTNTNSGSGTATVKRNSNPLFRLDYTMWSSPVNGAQTLAGFSPLTSQSPNRFFIYDNSTTNLVYVNVAPTSTFTTGTGYLIRMPNTDPTTDYDAGLATLAYPGQFTGTLNNGTVTLSGLASDKFYSVGNPYPSTLDAAAFIAANPGTLYFWRKTNLAPGTAYATYNTVGPVAAGSGLTGTGSEVPNGTIQVGQGFITKTGVAATSLVFTNAMRLGTASTQFFKTKQVAEKSRVWLNLTNTAGLFSQTLVGYLDEATLGVDNGIDGKYINDSATALTSNINGEEYTIQGRPAFDASDVVALNFKTDVAGDYTIALDHFDGLFTAGQDIYLKDNNTGAETDLKAGSYTFAAASGVDNTRFSLKYQKTLKVDDAVFNENNVAVYAKNGSLYVNSGEMAINSIQVYDVQGRLLAERKGLKTTTAILENLKANNQVLLVKVLGANNKVVTKKVVN
ncbi:T9SS sorting signal type C domain-containing protein [Flavobacterium sp.]|jgi:hypothetical protein|uniref:T9SS sorting signal type C domain-containing protein n=1 Tax=Flavobacterium sp. TaxID=239 RepID=UPI0037BFC9DC